MKVAVVGAGIAGLSAAHHLSGLGGVSVTVHEQLPRFGGRAGVNELGEHCPRFFMDDYTELFALLRRIPGRGGGSVHDSLRVVRRFAHTSAGWTEISHLYRVLAKEVPAREKLRMAWSWRPTPLLGEQAGRHNGNRYGRWHEMSPWPALRAASTVFRSTTGHVLPGATDDYLVEPWVRHLRDRGVTLCAGRRVLAVRPQAQGVALRTSAGWADFDAVVLAAHLPDLTHLLDASWLDHRLVDEGNLHCAAATVALDPREPLLGEPQPRFYGRDGLNMLVQPEAARAVVLCLRSAGTEPDYVARAVAERLGLTHPVLGVRGTTNHRPGEGLFAGHPVRAERILRRPVPHLYFAGSFLRSSYPIDAAETAARTAVAAVREITRDFGLTPSTAPERAS